MRRGVIRVLASLILVLALAAGGYMGLKTSTEKDVVSDNARLAAQATELQADRQRIGELDRASRAARRQAETDAKGRADELGKTMTDAVKAADAKASKATPTPTPGASMGPVKPYDGPVPTSCAQYTGHQAAGCALLLAGGFGLDQMPCLSKLWTKESKWNVTAKNSSSGAYGIPQALPGSKMATVGSDWQTSAETQIKWGLGYIKGRYGTPCGAWSHSQATGWY
ncbi:lytic transglycosylase domain-containing protein [Longispora albida]|uniref:aggregation-promoting factor C-terminal-like domain-containing protein n=1 Tax=Longispora albida TaxID=203523 RepID=UPI000369F824|nr:lytic transglycosylase domain-containing protein [Longispora albida]